MKRVVKPLAPEEQIQNYNQNELELSTVIFRLKRNAEIEPSDILNIDQMSIPNTYKKPQYKHIRESESSQVKERNDENRERVPSIAEELEKNEKNYRLVLKKFDSVSIFGEDEETFRKNYKTYYNDTNNKLKRENILKQKRKALLENPHSVEILNMNLNSDGNNVNQRQLELVSCMEIEKDKQLRDELEKEEYDCYFLERVPDIEVDKAPTIMFNDLTKAVIDNHLNKKGPFDDIQEVDSSSNINHQNSLYPSIEDSFLNENNKSHLLKTNFVDPNNFHNENHNQPLRAKPQMNYQRNDGFYQANGDYNQPTMNQSHQSNIHYSHHNNQFHPQDEEVPKHENYYAPSIDQLSSQRSIASSDVNNEVPLPESSERQEASKLKGPYGIFFIIQIAFILMSLKSFKIGYFSFPLVPACLGMLGIGIALIIFGHKSNRVVMFLVMYSMYFIWLVLFFKHMKLVMFAAALLSGGVCGLIGMFVIVLFKKRFADFIGFVSGTLISMLYFMGKKKLNHWKELDVLIVMGFFGGVLGMLFVRYVNRKRRIVFSTTLLGVFLMNVALNVLANNYFVWEYVLKPSKSHMWIFVFGILRQINLSSFSVKMKKIMCL